MENEELKMWCAIRTDLVIPIGKFGTQAGHAYANTLLEAYKNNPDLVNDYMANSSPKITVRADSEAMLLRIKQEADTAGLFNMLIVDAGRTVFDAPTITACAFGPCYKSQLPPFLKRLRLYK